MYFKKCPRAEGVAQVVKAPLLPIECKALNSNPSSAQKKEKYMFYVYFHPEESF
jgi:hypothetical protein